MLLNESWVESLLLFLMIVSKKENIVRGDNFIVDCVLFRLY